MTDQLKPQSEDVTMASVPPPPPPVSTPLGIGSQVQSGRPTAVTVIGIVLLVFAGIALITLPISLFMRSTANATGVQLFSIAVGIIGLVIEVVLGIALLRLLPWARKGAIIGLVALFLMGITSSLVAVSSMDLPKLPNGEGATIMRASMGIGMVVGILFSIAEYGVMIFFLTRPNVVAAFRARGEKG